MKDTPRRRAARSKTSAPNLSSTRNRRGAGRPAHQVARDIAITRRVRPLVGWTRTECLRRLAFALRPLIDTGLDAPTVAAELHSWYLDWRPARPAAYITAELRRRTARDTAVVPGTPTEPTPAFRAALARQDDGPVLADIAADEDTAGGDPLAGLTREETIAHRAAATADPALVRAAIEHLGMRHARRLYTSWLVNQALALAYRVSGRTVIHG